MSRRTTRLSVIPSRNVLRVAILAALSTAPVVHAATVPPGSALDASEFLVNTFISNSQSNVRVARDATGDFVMVWQSQNPAGGFNDYDIYAERYNAAGSPQGSAFLVNTFTTGTQALPAVAMDAAGDFVVTWQSYYQASSTSFNDIYARQYNAAGTALQASEFLVNTVTSDQQQLPAVAMDATGDFVVTWESRNQAVSNNYYDIYARQYSAAGTPKQVSEFLVDTATNGANRPVVAMDAAGDFVVAWHSYYNYDIYARQYDAAGTALQASQFLVNTFSTGGTNNPAVAMDAAGDFLVTWQSRNQAATNSNYDIYARQYRANGTALQASEFLVNTFTSNIQEFPAVAMDAAGDFVVAWQSLNQAATASGYDIYARQYRANGTALQASEFLVNTFTSNIQEFPAVAMDAAGDFVASWQSLNQAATASSYDIYSRRYQGQETVDLKTTFAASPASVNAGSAFTLTLGLNNNTAVSTAFSSATINSALGNASDISAVFTVPSGATLGTISGSNWTCGTVSAGSLSCSYTGALAAATAASALTLNFTAPASAGDLTFPVTVTATQQQSAFDSSGASATASVSVAAPSSSGGGGHHGGSSSSSGGGLGAFGLLSLAFLGLPLLGRRRRAR